jgi:uncharacterized membrane protein
MWNLIARLIGALLAILGAALLAYLGRLFYAPGERWLDVLVAIGMPSMLLLTLLGVVSVCGGLALLLRRDPAPDSAINSKFHHAPCVHADGNHPKTKD